MGCTVPLRRNRHLLPTIPDGTQLPPVTEYGGIQHVPGGTGRGRVTHCQNRPLNPVLGGLRRAQDVPRRPSEAPGGRPAALGGGQGNVGYHASPPDREWALRWAHEAPWRQLAAGGRVPARVARLTPCGRDRGGWPSGPPRPTT